MRREGFRASLLLATSAIAFATAAEAGETITYSYDALGRLTATSTNGTVNNGVSTSIGYDPAGNRSTYAVAGASSGGGGGGESPAPAVFAVGDAAAAENGSLVFTVTKTGGTGGASSVGYATADGSAAAGSDYQGTSGTLSFAAAETSKTVSVAAIDDTVDENDETLFLNLSGASAGASISDPQGVGTLADNDDPPPPPPPNNPPTATNNTGSQPKCSTAIYDVVSDDSDVDGDIPLVLHSVSGQGFFGISTTEIQFNSSSSTGWKTATYFVRDTRGELASATLKVNVVGGVCGPQASPSPAPPGKKGS